MEQIKKKARKGDRSFEISEKSVLPDNIIEHYSVIESKKTDTVSAKMKNAEWVKIAQKFGATLSIHLRDSFSLKMLWENLERKAKLLKNKRWGALKIVTYSIGTPFPYAPQIRALLITY